MRGVWRGGPALIWDTWYKVSSQQREAEQQIDSKQPGHNNIFNPRLKLVNSVKFWTIGYSQNWVKYEWFSAGILPLHASNIILNWENGLHFNFDTDVQKLLLCARPRNGYSLFALILTYNWKWIKFKPQDSRFELWNESVNVKVLIGNLKYWNDLSQYMTFNEEGLAPNVQSILYRFTKSVHPNECFTCYILQHLVT